MPEFVQFRQQPYAKVIFRFEDEKSLTAFSELIGQKLTAKTKSAWFPFRPHRKEGPRDVYRSEND